MVRRFGRGAINEVFYVNENQVIICSYGGAGLFDFNTGEAIWEIDCPASCAAVSHDGKFLALGGYKNNIYLWDLTNGQLLRKFEGHTNQINVITISKDNQYLVSSSYEYLRDSKSYDVTLKLWDLATGQEIRQFFGHTNQINVITISNDNQYIVSNSYDKTIRLWNIATGQEIKQFSDCDCVAISMIIAILYLFLVLFLISKRQ